MSKIKTRLPRMFQCNPVDAAQLPFDEHCPRCAEFKADLQPGLFTWQSAVAGHFQRAHEITIVGAGDKGYPGWVVPE